LIDVRNKVNCKAIKQNLKRILRGETNAAHKFIALTLIRLIADVQRQLIKAFYLMYRLENTPCTLVPCKMQPPMLMIHRTSASSLYRDPNHTNNNIQTFALPSLIFKAPHAVCLLVPVCPRRTMHSSPANVGFAIGSGSLSLHIAR